MRVVDNAKPLAAKKSAEIIEAAEYLLAAAKNGHLRGVVICTVSNAGSGGQAVVMTDKATEGDLASLNLRLDVSKTLLQRDLLQAIADAEDEDE